MLGASGLVMLSVPAIAGHHEGGDHSKGDKVKAMFQEADKNADGSISKDEYMEHVQAKAAEKFAKKDANSDGSISMEEAKEYKEMKKSKMKEKRGEMREKIKEKRMEMNEAAE